MSGSNTQHRSRRPFVMALVAVFIVLSLGAGAWVMRGKWSGGSRSSSDLKLVIRKFLLKESGLKTFTIPDEPVSGGVASVTTTNTTATTNKAGRIRTVRTTRLGLPGSNWSTWFRSEQEQAMSYKDMYRLIGQQLALADKLLTNSTAPENFLGLAMAGEASAYARTNTVNVWLGARICEAYLWPNLGMVETNKGGQLTSDALLNLCDIAFKEAGETNNIIRNYQMLIAKGASSAQLDILHYRLARVYMDMGENQKALEQFKLIKARTAKMERDFGALQVLMGMNKTKP